MTPLIELKGVTFVSDRGALLFDDADLSLFAGERVMVSAPYASGKGAFVKLLCGLARPVSGSIVLFGEDIVQMDRSGLDRTRRMAGFVFEDSALISNLKVIENVALPLLYHTSLGRDESMERALRLLETVGYALDVWLLPGALPIYERELVILARALALGPQAVVFEHLEVGLTEPQKRHIAGVLTGYQESSPERLLVFTSEKEEIKTLIRADRVVRIEDRGFAG